MKTKKSKYSRGKRTEKRELGILEDLLSSNPLITELTRGDDTFPDIDGYVHLLDEDDSVTGLMLKVQVKSLRRGKRGHLTVGCRNELLSHAHDSSTPVLIIGVDVEEREAYWAYLSPESVKELLGKQEGAGKKTATIRLRAHNSIKKGSDAYVKEWKKICLHHQNASNDKQIHRFARRISSGLAYSDDSTLRERIRSLQDLISYRTNNGEYPLTDIALRIAESISTSSVSVKKEYVELVERVIYHRTPESLSILATLALDESDAVARTASEALKKAAKYNFHVLNSIGYVPQRYILDFLATHEVPREIALGMLKHILEPDFEGTSQSDVRTFTFHRGPLNVTPYLRDIRRDAIQMLVKMFESEADLKAKVELIKTLSHATFKSDPPFGADPDHFERSIEMVEEDTETVVAKFEKIAFPDGTMTRDYPLVYEIEERISSLNARERKIPGVAELLERIRKDDGDYRLFSLLAGHEMRLRRDIEWREAEDQKESEIRAILDSINHGNAESWFNRIDAISEFRDVVEDWLLTSLRDFLGRLSEQKPDIGHIFASRAFSQRTGLYHFIANILLGLRRGGIELWDQQVRFIAEHELEDQVYGVLLSYEIHARPMDLTQIRHQDVEIVLQIAGKTGEFHFLHEMPPNRQREICLFRVLALLSTHDARIRKALTEKIAIESEWDALYTDQLGLALHSAWVNFRDWDADDLQAMAGLLIRIKRLEFYELQILHAIGLVDFALMMYVFEQRMKQPYVSGYDAIPYHFDTGLGTLIRDHADTEEIVVRWLKNLQPEINTFAHNLGELFGHVGGPALRRVLSDLIKSGVRENIIKVIALMPVSEPADSGLCLEIVSVTDDETILAMVEARMCQIGGASGAADENIFGRELRRKSADIQRIKEQSDDPRIIRFCERALANLAKDIAQSDEHHEREMRAQQEEFEREREE